MYSIMYNTINTFKVKEKKVNGSVVQYFYLDEMQKKYLQQENMHFQSNKLFESLQQC